MVDFSMCSDDTCPSAGYCKRNEKSGTTPDPIRQSYADFDREGDRECDFIVPVQY